VENIETTKRLRKHEKYIKEKVPIKDLKSHVESITTFDRNDLSLIIKNGEDGLPDHWIAGIRERRELSPGGYRSHHQTTAALFFICLGFIALVTTMISTIA
jgi:hypothetical protein